MSSLNPSAIDHLSFVMSYYNNPEMLRLQYELWASYPEEIRRRVDFVIVDDGSSEPAHLISIPTGLDVSIYRVLVDIPWNQDGARNLGCREASGPWLFMTDMDHMMPLSTLEYLFANRLDQRYAYTFARVEYVTKKPALDKHGKPKPHPNTYMMTKRMYWDVGGYDEYFRGLYGTDGMFNTRLRQRAQLRHISKPIERVSRDTVFDADTRGLSRKENRPRDFLVQAKKRKAADPQWSNEIMLLNFPWEKVR